MNKEDIKTAIINTIERLRQEDQSDESWKKEAIAELDERIAAYYKLTFKGSQQHAKYN